MLARQEPGLFGIKHSNRNFAQKDDWGKNQFNSSFPTSLSAYLEYQGFENVYLKLNENLRVYHSSISTTELYGAAPISEDIFYSFESLYVRFQQLVIGNFSRVDLVTLSRNNSCCLKGLEVKLTALPDNSTCELTADKFGCELVGRPDTIVYLACSIVMHFRKNRNELINLIGEGFEAIRDWK